MAESDWAFNEHECQGVIKHVERHQSKISIISVLLHYSVCTTLIIAQFLCRNNLDFLLEFSAQIELSNIEILSIKKVIIKMWLDDE